MRIIITILLTLLAIAPSWAKDTESGTPEYQIEGAGTGNSGTVLVKVTIVGKNKNVSDAQLGMSAIHGVLFRGYSDSNSSFTSTNATAMLGSPMAEQQHADFFKSFFGGTYSSYVQLVSDTRRVVKAGKDWKVSAVVAVSTSQLRQDLEKAGVLKSLKSGW